MPSVHTASLLASSRRSAPTLIQGLLAKLASAKTWASPRTTGCPTDKTEGPRVTHIAGILPFSKKGHWDWDSASLGVGEGSTLAALEGKIVTTWATSDTRGASPSLSATVLHPPLCCAIDFPSLGSFTSRGSDCLAKEARLTQRETSHFIITMTARGWISEEEERKSEMG